MERRGSFFQQPAENLAVLRLVHDLVGEHHLHRLLAGHRRRRALAQLVRLPQLAPVGVVDSMERLELSSVIFLPVHSSMECRKLSYSPVR